VTCSITNSEGNIYKIKINNNSFNIYIPKNDSNYCLQIIDEKLCKRIICSLEKTNGFNIKLDDNKTDKNKLKIIIKSEYSDNSYIKLLKNREEEFSVKKIKKLIITIHKSHRTFKK